MTFRWLMCNDNFFIPSWRKSHLSIYFHPISRDHDEIMRTLNQTAVVIVSVRFIHYYDRYSRPVGNGQIIIIYCSNRYFGAEERIFRGARVKCNIYHSETKRNNVTKNVTPLDRIIMIPTSRQQIKLPM